MIFSPQLAQAIEVGLTEQILCRVEPDAGHNVPDEKVASRIPRLLQNIKKHCHCATKFVFLITPELIVHLNRWLLFVMAKKYSRKNLYQIGLKSC